MPNLFIKWPKSQKILTQKIKFQIQWQALNITE